MIPGTGTGYGAYCTHYGTNDIFCIFLGVDVTVLFVRTVRAETCAHILYRFVLTADNNTAIFLIIYLHFTSRLRYMCTYQIFILTAISNTIGTFGRFGRYDVCSSGDQIACFLSRFVMKYNKLLLFNCTYV